MDALLPAPAEATTEAQRNRRAAILRAAAELLEEREYERIQMRDVAESAGVALGTLYRYFPSKEQLFVQVLRDWGAGLGERTRRPAASARTDAERLTQVLRTALRAFERRPNFFRLMVALQAVPDPQVSGPFGDYSQGFHAVIRAALLDTDPDDVEVVVTLAGALLNTVVQGWAHGKITTAEADRRLRKGVDLIFREPRPA